MVYVEHDQAISIYAGVSFGIKSHIGT
jgi:hypothetical protein